MARNRGTPIVIAALLAGCGRARSPSPPRPAPSPQTAVQPAPTAAPPAPQPTPPAPAPPARLAADATLVVEARHAGPRPASVYFGYSVVEESGGGEVGAHCNGTPPGPDGKLRIPLPAGTTRAYVCVWASRYEFAGQYIDLAAVAGKSEHHLSIPLVTGGRTIAGTVRTPSGTAQPAFVRITAVDPSDDSRRGGPEIATDRSGRFEVGGLDAGRYRLWVEPFDINGTIRGTATEAFAEPGATELVVRVPDRPRK